MVKVEQEINDSCDIPNKDFVILVTGWIPVGDMGQGQLRKQEWDGVFWSVKRCC